MVYKLIPVVWGIVINVVFFIGCITVGKGIMEERKIYKEINKSKDIK